MPEQALLTIAIGVAAEVFVIAAGAVFILISYMDKRFNEVLKRLNGK